jgi:TRAP-type mannitol/chloroaromatic compound transport system permease small subunit
VAEAEHRRRAARAAAARIEGFVDVLGEWTSWIALVIVVLMACAVVLRYLFSAGTVWEQELEWHLLSPLILFGMSYAMRQGAHVRVDILYARFSRRRQHAIDLFSALLTIAVSVLIVWYSLKYVGQAYVIDEGSPDPGGIPHRFILKAFIPAGFAILALQGAAAALHSAAQLRGRHR